MDKAHSTEEEKKEYFDTEEELERKVAILTDLVKKKQTFHRFYRSWYQHCCWDPRL